MTALRIGVQLHGHVGRFQSHVVAQCVLDAVDMIVLILQVLLRSYRPDEWKLWFDAAGVATPPIRGPIFDASPTIASAAASGVGVALLPGRLFEQDLASGRLVQPFNLCVDAGRYWLTRLKSRPETASMAALKEWLQQAAAY
jgi:LysR family transcriptional regulator of beta-lactamase